MLRAKAVPVVLGEIVSEGIRSALLLTTDGDLLGTTAEVGRMEQEHIIAAIMSNVFGEYERAGNECLGEPNLKFLLFSFEDGNVGLVKACRGYLLCAYADPDVDIGMLKRKLEAARDYLKEPLSQIDDTDDSGDESKQEQA